MTRKILCAACGTTVKLKGLSLIPGPCPVCKKRLPFTLPRSVTYTARTLWKPFLVVCAVVIIFVAVPIVRSFQASPQLPGRLNSSTYKSPQASHTLR